MINLDLTADALRTERKYNKKNYFTNNIQVEKSLTNTDVKWLKYLEKQAAEDDC